MLSRAHPAFPAACGFFRAVGSGGAVSIAPALTRGSLTETSPTSSSLDAPIARLEERRGKLAKDWLLHVLDRSSLDQIERLPTARVVRELPELISAILEDAETGGPPAARHREWALHLAQLAGREPGEAKEVSLDLAILQSVMVAELRRDADVFELEPALDAVERLAAVFGAMQFGAVEELSTGPVEPAEVAVDRLTGLRAVGYLDEQLRHLVGIQKRYGHPFAVLVLDVEGLKRINDAYGQAAGDQLLVGIAETLGGTIRSVDLPVRMDGDEFCVVAPEQTASGGRVLGHRIATALERVRGPGGQPPQIAIGVASCPQHGDEAQDLLDEADGAMYRAKASGERVAVGGAGGGATASEGG
jgi:diguanylate cyclase (GGDEF)-like protein